MNQFKKGDRVMILKLNASYHGGCIHRSKRGQVIDCNNSYGYFNIRWDDGYICNIDLSKDSVVKEKVTRSILEILNS
jgi:hypothetical protein